MQCNRDVSPVYWVVFGSCAALSLYVAASYSYTMLTTSLWNDEIYTIKFFSQSGLKTAWSDYHVPNNHILFNMLASFIKDAEAYNPAWARSLSVFSVAAAAFFVVKFAIESKGLLGGAIAVCALFMSTTSLDLMLQARGYGFLALAAAMQCYSARWLLRTQRWVDVFTFCLGGFIGGATIPIYAPFVGAFSLSLAVIIRSSRLLIGLTITAVVGVLFYLPTMAQIIENTSEYGSVWGYQYSSFASVAKTLEFLFAPDPISLMLLISLCACGAAGFLLRHGARDEAKLVLCLSLSVATFIAFCLIMKTPLIRTTQFIVIPITFMLSILVEEGINSLKRCLKLTNASTYPAQLPIAIAGLLAVWMGVAGVITYSKSQFVPIEAWRDIAHLAQHVHPNDKPVFSSFRSYQLGVNFDTPRLVRHTENLNAVTTSTPFFVVDGNFKTQDRYTYEGQIEHYVIDVRQRRGGFIRAIFSPQKSGAVSHFLVNGHDVSTDVLDDKPETRWTTRRPQELQKEPVLMHFLIAPNQACSRLFIYSANDDLPREFTVFGLGDQRPRRRLAAHQYNNSLMSIKLGVGHVHTVELEARSATGKRNYLSINEAWCAW